MSEGTITIGTDPRAKAGAAIWLGAEKVVSVAAGGQHSLLLTAQGTVLASGSNDSGQVEVPTSLSAVKAIAAGFSHSLALKLDGTVVAWGNNSRGATNVPLGLTDVVAVSGGGGHSMALKRDGTVIVWGQLGRGQLEPPSDLDDAVAIASGWECCFAIRRDGRVAAWGETQYGQPSIPPDIKDAISISGVAGPIPAWVIASRDGTVRASSARSSGAEPSDLRDVLQVSAGDMHYLALRRDGTVVGWGSSPVRHAVPMGLQDVTEISAGDHHSLALRHDGSVVAWGKKGHSQIDGPPGYTTETVEWEEDGYYLPSLGHRPSGAADPYVDEYGGRIGNLEELTEGSDRVASEDDIRLALRRAAEADERGDRSQAVQIYEAAIAHSQRYPRLHAIVVDGLALYWMRRREWPKAIRLLERLAESGESYGLGTLALCLMEEGRKKEAISTFEEAIRRWDETSVDRGDDHERLRAMTKASLGRAYLLQDELESGIHWLKEALDGDYMRANERADTHTKLGLALDHVGRSQEAISWLRLASESGDIKAYAHLGIALQKSGNEHEGLLWLTKAAEAGDVTGMLLVGTTLAARVNLSDSQQGWVWIRKAAATGNPVALDLIASSGGQGGRSAGATLSSPTSSSQSSGACYVATAVYGSYEATQVQILRRYRDQQLAGTVFGRLVIKTYYAVSPPMARYFAELPALNRFARHLLDGIVSRLDR